MVVSAEEYAACLKKHPEVVVVCVSNHQNRLGEQRALIHEMAAAGLTNPVIICQMYRHSQEEKGDFQLEAAADMGALMFDGLCDGIWLMNDGTLAPTDICDTAFGILQAARLRTSKTEYISCPMRSYTLRSAFHHSTHQRGNGSHDRTEDRHHGMYRKRSGRDGRCRLRLRGSRQRQNIALSS